MSLYFGIGDNFKSANVPSMVRASGQGALFTLRTLSELRSDLCAPTTAKGGRGVAPL
jgi:hypothetical protein